MSIFLANWKMYLTPSQSAAMAKLVIESKKHAKEVVLIPDFACLSATRDVISGSNVALGAQDCFWEKSGAYTGEVSAQELKEAGCSYVILGHSERRAFGETDHMVHKKLYAAIEAGLTPVVCVGEPYDKRQSDLQESYVKSQLESILRDLPLTRGHHIIFAYEPIWAISTHKQGVDITKDQISEMINYIHVFLKEHFTDDPAVWSVVYGGSVDAANIKGILAVPGVNGVLVGKASTKEEEMRGMLGGNRIMNYEL